MDQLKDNVKFTVFTVDGDFFDYIEPGVYAVRYDNLTWREAVQLCRLAFRQGHDVVLRAMPF